MSRSVNRSPDPARDAGWEDPPARKGFLTGHLDLHRMQGLRGGVQGVERDPRGWPLTARLVL